MDQPGAALAATLIVKRRTWLQDAVRVYRVDVDGVSVGKVGPLQTRSFDLLPGTHRIQLVVGRPRASSDVIELDIKPARRYLVRTVRRGSILSFLKLPFTIPEGAQALLEDRPINSRSYERPWIHVRTKSLET